MNTGSPAAWSEWPVCRLEALADPGAKAFHVGGGDWPFRGFVVRKGDEVFAYANICPHRRHPLDLEPDDFLVDGGKFIRCASHGALFIPETGFCIAGPCTGQNLTALGVRIDEERNVVVTAPESLRSGETPPRSDET